MRSRTTIVSAVLLGVVVFASGFFAYPMLVRPQASGTAEGIPIGGYFLINFYHANGALFATWQGHNTLLIRGQDELAQCMSGQSLPPILGTCEGPLQNVFASDGGAGYYTGAVTSSSLLPANCSPAGNPPTCTGWQTKGTITFSSGTFPDTIGIVGTSGATTLEFDSVSITPVSVSQGDTMSVTVTFSIS